jgi:hypothetical protein
MSDRSCDRTLENTDRTPETVDSVKRTVNLLHGTVNPVKRTVNLLHETVDFVPAIAVSRCEIVNLVREIIDFDEEKAEYMHERRDPRTSSSSRTRSSSPTKRLNQHQIHPIIQQRRLN